ncbi:MAG: class C sortase [Oscillospiraceae bacterium]|nr:class C sortase [Oscillospiraceae bacterium]
MAFLMALGLTLYPVISNYVNQKYASQIQTAYQEVMEQVDDTALREVKEQADIYNHSLIPGATEAYSQEGLLAASADYDSQLNLAGNGIMGYVEIPKISVNLPIYHGTENDSLERGIGHLLGSSLPIGGESTHTILSGHSGMASQKMFTDLEQLTVGDVFYLHVLDETLSYQVVEINTVLPYDTSLLGIAPGEDLCTLVTCTPYGVNTHRLLVRGSRIPYEEAEQLMEETASEEVAASTWEEKYLQGVILGIAAALVLILVIAIGTQIYQSIAGSSGGNGHAKH